MSNRKWYDLQELEGREKQNLSGSNIFNRCSVQILCFYISAKMSL